MVLMAVLLSGFLAGAPVGVQNPTPPTSQGTRTCREHPDVKPPCFKVHGRLSAWLGTPTFRIWVIGTNRILGVSDGRFRRPDYPQFPANVDSKVAWDVNIFGDFVVCPFEDDKPGVMRLVCVDSATSLVVRPRK
jgi:hypothetical protein